MIHYVAIVLILTATINVLQCLSVAGKNKGTAFVTGAVLFTAPIVVAAVFACIVAWG